MSTKLNVRFVPKYIDVIGELKIYNDNNECIQTESKQFEFYYDKDGNLIKKE